MTALVASPIDEDGFFVVPGALAPFEVDAIAAAIGALTKRVTETGRGGSRRLFEDVPEVRALAFHPTVRGAAVGALGPACFPVRALLFDKTATANWKVAWHQDLTIAVRAHREVEGYGPWSSKGGVPHVQPPISVLERMVAVRVHLDDCGADHGPVRVLPGSHRAGPISAAEVEVWLATACRRGDLPCPARRAPGDAAPAPSRIVAGEEPGA